MSNDPHGSDSTNADLPTYERSLKIWSIRAMIALVLAYGVARYNGGPSWIVAAGWTYVGISLVVSLSTVFFARRMMTNANARRDDE